MLSPSTGGRDVTVDSTDDAAAVVAALRPAAAGPARRPVAAGRAARDRPLPRWPPARCAVRGPGPRPGRPARARRAAPAAGPGRLQAAMRRAGVSAQPARRGLRRRTTRRRPRGPGGCSATSGTRRCGSWTVATWPGWPPASPSRPGPPRPAGSRHVHRPARSPAAARRRRRGPDGPRAACCWTPGRRSATGARPSRSTRSPGTSPAAVSAPTAERGPGRPVPGPCDVAGPVHRARGRSGRARQPVGAARTRTAGAGAAPAGAARRDGRHGGSGDDRGVLRLRGDRGARGAGAGVAGIPAALYLAPGPTGSPTPAARRHRPRLTLRAPAPPPRRR